MICASRLTAFSLCMIMGLSLGAPMALAQANLPEFTVLDIGELNLDTDHVGDKSYKEKMSEVDNEDMRTHLVLQNEITMLGALQNWQEQVSELRKTYAKANIPFSQPDPPRNICEQVPSNKICNDAYPDLVLKPKESETVSNINDLRVSGVDIPKVNEVVAEPVSRANNYEWASVSCLGNDCKAVLLDKVQNLRFSVTNGEAIDEGVTVSNITPMGVMVREKDKVVKLRSSEPSVSSDDSLSVNPLSTTDKLTDQLSNLPANSLDNIEPVQPIVIDDGSKDVEPPVGATGLF